MSDAEAQAARLLAVRGIATGFHPPVANNFVHMLVPRDRDLAEYIAGIAETTAWLNRADQGLLQHCSELLAAAAPEPGAFALAQWRGCIARRVNLQAVRWVPQVIAAVERRVGVPIGEHLATAAPEVLARFREVPRGLLELVRVNAYLPPSAIAGALERLVARIEAGGLATPIDRLEVARLGEVPAGIAPDFPTVIVYLDVERTSEAAIAQTLGVLARMLASLAPAPALRRELAWPLGTHATLTQGFTLYKRYLGWLGLLDGIYDPAFDHALCRGSRLARVATADPAALGYPRGHAHGPSPVSRCARGLRPEGG